MIRRLRNMIEQLDRRCLERWGIAVARVERFVSQAEI